MNEKEIIRTALKVRGINQTILANRANLKRQSNVAEMLRGKSMRVDNLVRLLDAMDFDVIIKDRNGANRENVWKVEYDVTEWKKDQEKE